MKKWYVSLLAAVFLLAVQMAGTGRTVYASASTSYDLTVDYSKRYLHSGGAVTLTASLARDSEEEAGNVEDAEFKWKATITDSAGEAMETGGQTVQLRPNGNGSVCEVEAPVIMGEDNVEQDYSIVIWRQVLVDGKEVMPWKELEHDLEVRKSYYKIELENRDEINAMWPGDESLTLEPKVYLYKKGEEKQEETNLRYTFSCTPYVFKIKDGSGQNMEDDAGAENPYSGPFTVVRQGIDGGYIRAWAWHNEEGTEYWSRLENIENPEWYFDEVSCGEINIVREGQPIHPEWLFADEGEKGTFSLDMEDPGNSTVQWEITIYGIGNPLKAPKKDTEGNDLYTVRGDRGETIDIYAKTLKAFIEKRLGSKVETAYIDLSANVMVGNTELDGRTKDITIHSPQYRLMTNLKDHLLLGQGIMYADGTVMCWAKNADYPEGKEETVKIAGLDIEQHPDDVSGAEVIHKEEGEGGAIQLTAQASGYANLKYLLEFPSQNTVTTVTLPVKIYVEKYIYSCEVKSSTGSTGSGGDMESAALRPGESLKLETTVWREYYDAADEADPYKKEKLSAGAYTLSYRDDGMNLVTWDQEGNVTARETEADGDTSIYAEVTIPQGEGKDPVKLKKQFYIQIRLGCAHDFAQKEIVKPASCTEKGIRRLECSKCHETMEQEIPATGHTAGAWTVTKQPTATEAGKEEQKCTVCGRVLGTRELPATGNAECQHIAGTWRVAKQPTCTTLGLQEQTCSKCGAVMNTKEIPAPGHSFGEWKETNKATVLREGTRTRTCTVCGAEETENTAKAKAVIKLNVKSIPLQVKKSTAAVKVISMGEGDAVQSWKSSKPQIASVDKKGKITGKKAGTAKITVTLRSGVSASVTVKVQKKAVKTTKLSVTGKSVKKNAVTLKKGKSLTLAVTKTPVTSLDKVTYTSSDKKIATVSKKGKITAKKTGKARITVKAGKKKVVIKVTVKK